MVKSCTYREDRKPDGSTESKPFTVRRNNQVLRTLPCVTPSNYDKNEVEEPNLTRSIQLERKVEEKDDGGRLERKVKVCQCGGLRSGT